MLLQVSIPSGKLVSRNRQRGTGYTGADLLSLHSLLQTTSACGVVKHLIKLHYGRSLPHSSSVAVAVVAVAGAIYVFAAAATALLTQRRSAEQRRR